MRFRHLESCHERHSQPARRAAGAQRRQRDRFEFSDSSMTLMNPHHAYATVEDAIGYVARLQAARSDEVLFIWQMGTVPQWAQLETIRNIGEQLIPHFRA